MNRTGKIIQRFGGIRPMARLLGLPKSTVHSWKCTDRIPAQHQPHVLECGRQLDPPLVADDFFVAAPPVSDPPPEAETGARART